VPPFFFVFFWILCFFDLFFGPRIFDPHIQSILRKLLFQQQFSDKRRENCLLRLFSEFFFLSLRWTTPLSESVYHIGAFKRRFFLIFFSSFGCLVSYFFLLSNYVLGFLPRLFPFFNENARSWDCMWSNDSNHYESLRCALPARYSFSSPIEFMISFIGYLQLAFLIEFQ